MGQDNTQPASGWVGITADGSLIQTAINTATGSDNAHLRGIFCTTSGAATLVDQGGTSVTFEFVAGQVYPLKPASYTTSGAVAVLVALYGG
jgi:hypothetical protein